MQLQDLLKFNSIIKENLNQMKKQIVLLSTFLLMSIFAISATAVKDTTSIDTEINKVTVFFSGAQVERSSKIELNKGAHLLKISGLSYKLNPKSLQVKGTGNLTILSVKHETLQPGNAKQTMLSKRINKEMGLIRYDIQDLNNQNYVLAQEEQLIMEHRSVRDEFGAVKISELKEAAIFFRERLSEIRKMILENNKLIDAMNESIGELNTKLNLSNPTSNKYSSELYVSVLAEELLNEDIEISYYVESAGWKPMYEFRVDEVSKPINIVYKASVFQSSGEDWDNVKLTLSSSNPMLSGEKPELRTWYINQPQPVYTKAYQPANGTTLLKGKAYDNQTGEPLPFANIAIYQNNQLVQGTNTDVNGNFIINPINPGYYQIRTSYIGYNNGAQNVSVVQGQQPFMNLAMQASYEELSEVVVVSDLARAEEYLSGSVVAVNSASNLIQANPQSVTKLNGSTIKQKQQIQTINFIANKTKRNVANLEYSIDAPYTILSDGKENKIRIKEVATAVEYVYHAVPQIDMDVFLTANLNNWTELDLLSGPTTIFYEGTFIGESTLDVANTSDTMIISLGRDKNIIVERESDKDLSEKRIFGKTIKDFIAWKITVRNNRPIPIKLIIEEQIPVTNNKAIEIELVKSSNASFDERTGIMEWELELNAYKKKKLDYKYVVKYPENIRINYN